MFAGSMILLVGFFNVIDGLVAVFNSHYFSAIAAGRGVTLPVVNNQLNAWGWVAFGIGVVMVLTALGIYARASWARVIGIVLAGANMIFQLAFLAAFPAWSFVMILVDALVIYGLAVHGGELTA
ncbi:MAG TPA: hypothetical protein VE152_07000 [Acidimicrobiales bacterium]|nr:hypothetical protein [Acidimicrobiales bacterium]